MDASSRLTALNQDPERRKSIPPGKLPYHERLRGRAAHNPFQIGWRGWWDILVRVVERVSIDNLGLITAGVTFYVFLALIPAMIAVVTFYGITTSSLTLATHVSFLHGYLPDQAIEWIGHEIGRLAKAQEDGLTLTFVLSLGDFAMVDEQCGDRSLRRDEHRLRGGREARDHRALPQGIRGDAGRAFRRHRDDRCHRRGASGVRPRGWRARLWRPTRDGADPLHPGLDRLGDDLPARAKPARRRGGAGSRSAR